MDPTARDKENHLPFPKQLQTSRGAAAQARIGLCVALSGKVKASSASADWLPSKAVVFHVPERARAPPAPPQDSISVSALLTMIKTPAVIELCSGHMYHPHYRSIDCQCLCSHVSGQPRLHPISCHAVGISCPVLVGCITTCRSSQHLYHASMSNGSLYHGHVHIKTVSDQSIPINRCS